MLLVRVYIWLLCMMGNKSLYLGTLFILMVRKTLDQKAIIINRKTLDHKMFSQSDKAQNSLSFLFFEMA